MIILAIDTSTLFSSIAIFKDGQCLKSCNYETTLTQSAASLLVPHIQDMLEACDLSTKDLTHVAVNRGPGSFTGIRVGLATANGIAFANQIPLLGVSAFDALHHAIKDDAAYPLILLRDTKCGSDYQASYETAHIQPTLDVVMRDELADKLAHAKSVVADAPEALITSAPACAFTHFTLHAEHIARYAFDNIEGADSFLSQPLYIKSPNITMRPPVLWKDAHASEVPDY